MKKTALSKRKSEWISSSFGEEIVASQPKRSSQKNGTAAIIDLTKEEDSNQGSLSSKDIRKEDIPWIDLYKPKTESELAVNKKKVEEVKEWLLNVKKQQKNRGILVLSGSCGTGKTAVIEVLSKSFNYQIKEWINPVSMESQERMPMNWNDFDNRQDSQTQQFSDFILRANRYNGLSLFGDPEASLEESQKIVLVEDLPNFSLHDPSKLHIILRQYNQTGRSPLVFIISDTHNNSEASLHSIFPKSTQQELNICNISFNLASATSLKSVMQKIVQQESSLYEGLKIPSKETYDLLVSSSSGDIRSCINALQFYCTQRQAADKSKRVATTRTTKSKSRQKVKTSGNKDNDVLFSGRDASLFLFRSLGKILYCKREELKKEDTILQLPPYLSKHSRKKLLEDPESVFERTQVTSDTFLLYLHQNYLEFFNNIDSLSTASMYIEDADIMSSVWNSRHVMSDYCSSVSMRGIMFTNATSTSTKSTCSSGWKPLHKPEFFQFFKTKNSKQSITRSLFKDSRHPEQDLFNEILPYMGKINPKMNTAGHQLFVNEIATFNVIKNTFCRNHLQTFTERSDLTMLSKGDGLESTCRYDNVVNSEDLIDESGYDQEDIIEDFDD